MDWIAPETADYLWKLALWAIGACIFVLGADMLSRRRKGGERLTAETALKVLSDNAFVIFIILAFFAFDTGPDGPSYFVILPTFAVLIALSAWLHMRQQRRAQANAVDNPDAQDGRAPLPVRLSAEERRVSFKINALVIAFAAVTVGAICWVAITMPPLDLSGLVFLLIICVLALAFLTYCVAGRWPFPVQKGASAEIAASPEAVWNVLRYKENRPYYRGNVRLVERLPEAGEAYRLRYFNTDNCGACGLPKHPDSEGPVSRIEILEAREPNVYRLRAFPKGTGWFGASMMEREDESFSIMPLPGGTSRVSAKSVAVKPAAWLALILKIGDPVGEQLRHLKAHMEGKAGETLYDATAERIAEARKAPKFCGCQGAAAPQLTAGQF
jgi:hypothetical protein